MLPRPIRVADGLLIGLGGLRLAWRLWRAAPSAAALAAALLLAAAPPPWADCASDCCDIRLLERPASECGQLRQGAGGARGATAAGGG
jgi:hypothetical protein